MREFVQRMEIEKENNIGKGDWNKWVPHPSDWLWELQYHISKLQKAIQDKDLNLIQEHSADIGLYAEKAFYIYGFNMEQKLVQKLIEKHKNIYEKFLLSSTHQLAYDTMGGLVFISKKEFLHNYDETLPYAVYDKNGQIIL